MSTSLAEQLRRLAVPQTNLLTRDKKRPSLLFDPKEAANLDRETVYQIGIDGLEELKQRCPAFAQFENTLFHVTSKNIERSVESAEVNQRLNKNIRKFLLQLSPYFLLNCSYKALEWLVYRFHVHEYNKEDLLILILPYHETNIFVRVLQLLNLNEPSEKWGWLMPLQKPGIHLPKQTLYNHAASDPYFIQFVSNFVLAIIKEHDKPSSLTTVFNFYCTTFTGALEYSSKVNEAQISQMLPLLLQGLISNIPDFAAATYVVITKLVTKTILSHKILDKFVEKISQLNSPYLKNEAVLVLVVLYQSQKQFNKISGVTVTNLYRKDGIPKIIEQLNKEGIHIYPFLTPLTSCCINCIIAKEDNEEFVNFLDCLITEIKIDDSFVEILLNTILNVYNPKRTYSEKNMTWLKEFMRKLERQHPVVYDRIIKKIMKPSEDQNIIKHQRVLRTLVENLTNMQDSFEIFEKLYHPTSGIRIEGLRILNKKFNKLRKKDAELVRNALIDRLNDENSKVVKEVLSTFNSKLSEIIDKDVLRNVLIKLLAKCQHKRDEWFQISLEVLLVTCNYFNSSDVQVFFAIFSFLFPLNEHELQVSLQIVRSNFFRNKMLPQQLRDSSKANDFFNASLNYFKSSENIPDIRLLIDTLKNMPEDYNHALNKFFAIMLLSNAYPEDSDVEVSILVLDIFEKLLNTCIAVEVDEKPTDFNCMVLARKNRFPIQGFLKYIKIIMMKTKKSTNEPTFIDFTVESDWSKFYSRLLNILIRNSNDPKFFSLASDGMQMFFSRFCNGESIVQCEFLLNFAVANDELRFNCVKILHGILTKEKDTSLFVSFNQNVIPNILVGLTLPHEKIRKILLDIVFKLSKSEPNSGNYVEFLRAILKHDEEILLDNEQMPLIMFNLLSPSSNGKSSFKEILKILLTCADNIKNPSYIKAGLVALLTYINDSDVYLTLSKIAANILNRGGSKLISSEAEILYKNILRFDSIIAKILTEDSPIWDLIQLSIKNDTLEMKCNNKLTCPAVLMLNQIERDAFSNLKLPMQQLLLDLITTTATTTQNPDVLQAANHVFKRIDLDLALVLSKFQKMRDIQSEKQAAASKRRKSVLPTPDILDTIEWKSGITILENIQNKKKIRNVPIVLPVLFDILKKCLDFDEQATVEYPKQLLLSTMLHCCSKMDEESIPENAFNMQLVVQCVRASQNPQTHHHALLLLAQTASLIPKQVLHHIIEIFTFVGSSVLRHDDAYSFQIISKIIDTIIPVLVEDNSEESLAKVLRVFVDAILDVPEHRRMILFKQLLERLGVGEVLNIFILLICEAHVVHGHTEKQKVNKNRSLSNLDESPKRLDIAADLCREFSTEIIISNCIKVLQYLRKLPEQKDDYTGKIDTYTFDIKHYNPKQFRHYKYTIITFISNLLASPQFINSVAALPDDDVLKLEDLFKKMIIDVLNYIQDTSKIAERNTNTPHAQYWKVMLHHSYDTLDAINALLTNQMFLLVIRGLMVYSLSTVRKRALEMLNNKLQHNTTFFYDCDKSKLYDLIVIPLVNIIKTLEKSEIESEQELIVQRALISLKLLVKNVASDEPEKFAQILDFISELTKRGVGSFHENILASLILCIAELCNSLKAHAIFCLNKFMPILIKVLKSHKNLESPSLLIISDITALYKIFDSLPLFLSPYMEKLLYELSSCASKWSSQADEPKLAQFISKLTGIQQKIGTIIPLRVLLVAVQNSYNSLVEKRNFAAIGPLMSILSENLKNLKGAEIQGNVPELTNFFLNALQFRVNSQASLEEANIVEEQVIKAFECLVLKLSESTFRPLYYKIFDWAVRTDAKTERVITFYNLSSAFANCLKGLFILFAGHFLNNAASLLDECNTIKNQELYFDDESKNVPLLENIIKTLHAVFLYDSQKFVTKERFEVLMQPVVDQLENTLGGMEALENRSKNILTPCIVQFAVATADDALWKQINYQILLKTRHNSPKIRLIALECLGETAKKLGEDFLPLLPETIPFLSELLEDEEEFVEKACQRTVQELEKVLGEPLQKYF